MTQKRGYVFEVTVTAKPKDLDELVEWVRTDKTLREYLGYVIGQAISEVMANKTGKRVNYVAAFDKTDSTPNV